MAQPGPGLASSHITTRAANIPLARARSLHAFEFGENYSVAIPVRAREHVLS